MKICLLSTDSFFSSENNLHVLDESAALVDQASVRFGPSGPPYGQISTVLRTIPGAILKSRVIER